jgi:hypothetical protein
MEELEKVEINDQLLQAFKEVQQPRTEFQLRKFVVGQHGIPEQDYAQCVVELQLKYNNLRRAKIHLEKTKHQVSELSKKTDKLSEFTRREKEIDKEECGLAVIGALREFEILYQIWNEFPKKYTRAEIDRVQPEYWKKRLTKQANQDLMANGRVSVGNQNVLSQIGMAVTPELDHVREIETNYLENGNTKILIAVATEHKAEDGLPCLDGLIIPSGIQAKFYNCFGRSVAEAYNDIARTFLKDGADFLLTIEDDTFPPPDALVRLMQHVKDGKKIVGAWYPKRNEAREAAPIILKNGKRGPLDADGKMHEVYTLPMGCTLYTAEVFMRTEFPWFETTECLTQDSFFSQKLREAGFILHCDTSIRCRHIDRQTGKVYE